MVWSQGHYRHYFAFGSNMNPARVRARGLVVETIVGARLEGFELVFNKRARDRDDLGRANIRPCRGTWVEGVLYRLAHHREIDKMDRFEGTPGQYSRELVSVTTDSGVSWAWTYVANPAVVLDGLLPDQAYLEHLLAGAEFLSPGYLERLKEWPTR
jgi:hypothetical protein